LYIATIMSTGSDPQSTIDLVRAASRQLVRELGFMNSSIAGTDLPPSAVHALIEIDARDGITASDLGELLRLEKSSVSRMLRKLVLGGEVVEVPDEHDRRTKILSLSPAGRQRVVGIHGFACAQVASALGQLGPEQRQTVLHGLQLYGAALATSRDERAPALPPNIVAGYRPGLVARITEMHMLRYARLGFGQKFESYIAGGLSEFCDRLEKPCNAIWLVLQDERIVGSVAIDGEDLGAGVAHLRWYIVDDDVRASGAGRGLLDEAMAFLDEKHFTETHLWIFADLSAAQYSFESYGFEWVEQGRGSQWGKEVVAQRFVRCGR
jgi:DNA-binding MarR family transcriptional regulator/N-acetylglutamate synthase-like GNAT family acetyltransferase